MPHSRYLTKSKFALGLECETKLFYANRPDEYLNESVEDEFLQALVEGGFQVGELAKFLLCDAPDQDTIRALSHDAALAETAKWLARPGRVTIAEAAFRHGDLFVRTDIVVREGRTLHVYEVKAKSWDEDMAFWSARGGLNGNWQKPLYDVAFQKYVVQLACPGLVVKAYLVLANKGAMASVDGLNQLFKVVTAAGRKSVQVRPGLRKADVGTPVLAVIPVDDDVQQIWDLPLTRPNGRTYTLTEFIEHLTDLQSRGVREFVPVHKSVCKDCQFGYGARKEADGELKNGFRECWRKQFGKGSDFSRDTVMDLWNFRKADDLLGAGRPYIQDIRQTDLGSGARAERQWLQVEKARNGDETPWLAREELAAEMRRWRWPLHSIDFETSRVALPFTQGRGPYEQIAFQFSHHTVDETGRIVHAGQWLADSRPGYFPNFDFVRALKRELDGDNGSIFCYAIHENTVLKEIHQQLADSAEPDRQRLMAWIQTITECKGNVGKQKVATWHGKRCMVDMRELVVRYHYDPFTHGSNSLKAVLPAVMHSSPKLRRKYGAPVYGTQKMPSLNYTNWVWIRQECNNDPYQALPSLFDPGDPVRKLAESLEAGEEAAPGAINNGGAALVAYAKLQFEDIPQNYRRRLCAGLLRYCELDTLAMVMLYEYWQEECGLQIKCSDG